MNPASSVSTPAPEQGAPPLADLIEELTNRLQAGEAVDLEAYSAQYPEHASAIRDLLPALQVLAGMSGSGAAGPDGAGLLPEAVLEVRTLGDFRIIREVGRGGMGIVYEAEQISLGRRVALKVLPFAATMDPRQLQRFHNEARAVASLHHEHIVPVYAVGCERAVHFYAVQFIEGKSLAELIAAQAQPTASGGRRPPDSDPNQGADAPRSPSADTRPAAASPTAAAPRDAAYFRRIAEWGTQAAEALEHAHSLGIVHRDVKPANLIVDGQGKLWVTDFGLARTATDAGLTMSGDLLGTLRYMSLEQALAKHGLVDHRTDVYSLGATLYELLAGRPAVEGQDRQEILRRIADEEPPPPRRHDRAVPADLETIVLKALAKEPTERYATARELADDLRRFLEDRPIVAKRPTLPQRLRKWSQRHRHLVGATALFLALVVVGLAASALLLWREKEQTQKALAQARANHTQAEAQRQRAETNFREAYWTVEDLLCAFDPDQSSQPVSVAELRQWQTETALRFLARFCEDPSDEPAVRLQKGVAYVHTGRIYQVLGEREKARKAFRQAIAVFDRLAQDFPGDSTYLRELASALGILAEDLYQAGQVSDANGYFRQAVSAWREAVRDHPDDVETCLQLAGALCHWYDPQLRDPLAAVGLARRAVELAPHFSYSWIALGVAYYRTGQWEAAVGAFREAFQGKEIENRAGWTYGLFFLAMAQWRCGRKEEAMNVYHRAARRMEKSFLPHDLLHRTIRAEAAALLGIKEPATPKPKEESPGKD